MSKLPNDIRALRKHAGLTQAALGEAVGLTQGQIGRLETGERELTHYWMRKIAGALNVATADLLPYQDVPDRLTQDEAALIALYRAAPSDVRRHMLTVIAALANPHDKIDTAA